MATTLALHSMLFGQVLSWITLDELRVMRVCKMTRYVRCYEYTICVHATRSERNEVCLYPNEILQIEIETMTASNTATKVSGRRLQFRIYQSGHKSRRMFPSSSGASCCFIHLSGTWISVNISFEIAITHEMNQELTRGKYRSMAERNRCLYCLGPIMVGSPLFAPPRNAESLTQLSNFLSHVYVRMKSSEKKIRKSVHGSSM